ncbi:hypothetical protein PV326_011231 [Microctonus aethiopoides]|nr:hypothetical protein PV326_011231 [Microctonus aethiopoides]
MDIRRLVTAPDFRNILSNIRLAFVIMLMTCMCFNFINQLLRRDTCATVAEIVDIIGFLSGGISLLIRLTVLIIHRNLMCMCINFVNQLLRKGACGTITELVDIISMFSCGCSLFTKLTVLMIHQNEMSIIVNSTVKDWSDIIDDKSRSIMLQYAKIGRWVFISQAICFISSFFGQFHVISANFKYFSECSNNEYYTRQLVKLIERHQHLLTMANGFEDIYNLLILIHFGIAIMIICISGIILLISLQSSDLVIVVDMAGRIIATSFQLFMYCYTGEQLRTEAMNVKNVIYNSSWFNMPLSTVKNMVFVIMRSDYPVSLTAGKIYEMNVPNFLVIVKTITSYFSVIRLAFK